MIYRNATIEDIPKIEQLQQVYHISTISDEDKLNGFVTTLFTREQFAELIETEKGLVIACDGDRIVAYVMAASWHYWQKWPLFQHMIKELPLTQYLGQTLSVENSYQYGPICIHKDYRGTDVLPQIFEFSRVQMNKRFPILITFINHINPRSYKAHVDKLGLDVIKSFEFNGNQYYELGYDTAKTTNNLVAIEEQKITLKAITIGSDQLVTGEALYDLYEALGWNDFLKLSQEALFQAMAGSYKVLYATIGNRLVGTGRLISDGITNAYFCGLGVHPDFQGIGIGSELTKQLFESAKEKGLHLQFFCEPSLVPYYEKLGCKVFATGMKA